MVLVGLAVVTLICALQAVRSPRLLSAALWLAGASAGTALLLYALGARQAAVIELSVGAGLVLILFVFTINLAGESELARPAVPRLLAGALTGLSLLLLGLLAWPQLQPQPAALAAPLRLTLWLDRPLDVLAQFALIFTGALTIMGFLANLAEAAAQHQAEAAVPPEALLAADGRDHALPAEPLELVAAARPTDAHPEAVP